MEKESDAPHLISNIEVMELLKTRLESRASQKKSHKLRHRDWIEEKVHEHLQSTPCTRLDPSKREELQSALSSSKKQAVASGAMQTTGFGLTEAESLQILNFMPSEEVEIHLLIDDLHDRMPDKQQTDLLATIKGYVKKEPPGGSEMTNGGAYGATAPVIKKEEEEDYTEIMNGGERAIT